MDAGHEAAGGKPKCSAIGRVGASTAEACQRARGICSQRSAEGFCARITVQQPADCNAPGCACGLAPKLGRRCAAPAAARRAGGRKGALRGHEPIRHEA
eukprot:3823477-Prymnesium_polylepis.1